MLIIQPFENSVSCSLKMCFYFPENVKRILLADLAKYKNMEKFQNFYQNHGLTPLEKS